LKQFKELKEKIMGNPRPKLLNGRAKMSGSMLLDFADSIVSQNNSQSAEDDPLDISSAY
jgi:hypothetical protein